MCVAWTWAGLHCRSWQTTQQSERQWRWWLRVGVFVQVYTECGVVWG
jgi:hypothetical protein